MHFKKKYHDKKFSNLLQESKEVFYILVTENRISSKNGNFLQSQFLLKMSTRKCM